MPCGLVRGKPQGLAHTIAFCGFLSLATVSQTLPVMADYTTAKQNFDRLDVDSQVSIILGLIATGDFVGLQENGFTKRFYNGVLAFQAREGFFPDGILDAIDMKRLNERANPFYGTPGVKTFTNPISKSKMLVPRLAFDSEKLT